MSRFLDVLQSGRVLLMDGAMGTELQGAGMGEGDCHELWNLTHPKRVQAVHQTYVDAGAEVLLTNTFQANPEALARHGLREQLDRINQAAVDLARDAAGPGRFVLADVGPAVGLDLAAAQELTRSFRGADALLLETCSDLSLLPCCLDARQDGWPVFLSFAFLRTPDGELQTRLGDSPETCARRAAAFPIAALGVNCGRDIGMDDIIAILRRYRQATDLPLFARPNAGTPTRSGSRWVYPLTPEQMASRLPELLQMAVALVGGCCGTTAAHIAALLPIVAAWNERTTPPKPGLESSSDKGVLG
jgi:methionine synthase I (cobalamin-dependent)